MPLKGFGYGCKTTAEVTQLKQLNLDWFYTWNQIPNLAMPATDIPSFVPMLWSDSTARTDALASDITAMNPKPTHLLGFNEPDHPSQSNMTPLEALWNWHHLTDRKSIVPGLKIGSPAALSTNTKWMDQFMVSANSLELQVDFIACHIYQNPSVTTFLSKIDALYAKWGKPVWVTETSVADWDAPVGGTSKYGRTEIDTYLAALWPELMKRPWLERFAWKTRASTDPQMGTASLFHTNGSLTTTGQLYASLNS